MEGLFAICVFGMIYLIAKCKVTDFKCRDYAEKHGNEMYASSTGLRYTKNNDLVFGDKKK